MQLARTLAAALLLAPLCACRSGAEVEDVEFTRVRAGQVSPISEAKNTVARSFVEWQAFCGDRDQGMWAIGTGIDWSKQMLIAVAIGSRPSGGYAVEIDRVYRKGSHWEVHARESRPGQGTLQTAMLTAPFDCVVTANYPGKVVFKVE